MNEHQRGCVLFATTEFHPAIAGGAGILIHHTVRLLLEQGFTVLLLLEGGRSAVEQLVDTARLKMPFGHRLLVYFVDELCEDLTVSDLYLDEVVRASLRLDHALRKLTEIHDIDLIELSDFYGHGFHYLAHPAEERPPVAVRLHSTVELLERQTRVPLTAKRLWLYAMERAQLALADVVLSPGMKFYEADVRPLYPTLAPERVLVSPPVHMPIGEVGYDPGASDIAFYGRLSTLKGLDTFLRAGVLALEDPAFADWLGRFVVIGPEDPNATALSPAELRGLIPADKVDRFQFTGRLDHIALVEQLQSVAFACFANKVESFCYAAHELHTAGIPLIVNRIPAFEDGFEAGVSAVFFAGTALDLAEQMRGLAQDAPMRVNLSQHGKARAAAYWTNHYTGHLSWLARRRAAAGNAAPSGSAIILSTGDRAAADRTVTSLSSLPLRPIILELDAAGDVDFAGHRWHGVTQAVGRAAPVGLERVGEACLFLRAGDVVEPQWADEALHALAQNPGVGGVGGWLRTRFGIESLSYLYVPELAQHAEPGLRVLLRVGAGQTLAEYLHGSSSQSERSYLLAHRAAGRVCVELPRLAIDTRRAVDLPAIRGSGNAVDFDRFSREFLMLAEASGAARSERGVNDRLPDSDPDLLATMVMPSLVVVRKARRPPGELSVLRLVRNDQVIELDSSTLTGSGSMRFHSQGRTAVDLRRGPACGACEIVHRGRAYTIDLKQPSEEVHRVWLDTLGSEHSSMQAARKPGYLPPPTVLLRLDDKGREIKSSATRRPLQPKQTALKEEPLRADYHETQALLLDPANAALKTLNINAVTIDLIAVAEPGDASIAGMLRFRSRCCVLTPEELGLRAAQNPTTGIAYALQTIRNIDSNRVAIDTAVPEGVEFADALLRAGSETEVTCLLGETAPLGAGGPSEVYRGLGPWLRLAARFPTRLRAASRSEGLLGLFSHCGIHALKIPARLPQLRAVEYGEGDIEVVVVPGTGTVANTSHMIMAVAQARRTGLAIGRLWLSRDDEQGLRLAQRFLAAPETERYDDLGMVFGDDPRRRVVLSVFPDDDELPQVASQALNWGALPILGPASAFAQCAMLRDALCVTYWEDALAIADALTRAAEGFDRFAGAYADFHRDRENVTEAGLSALVAGSFDRGDLI